MLIWHNDDDRNVEFSQTIGLVDLLRARNVYYELIVNPDDTHETLLHSRWLYTFGRMDTFLRPLPAERSGLERMTRSSPLSVPTIDSRRRIGRAGAALTPRPHPTVEIRPLRTNEECEACVALQRQVWGFEPTRRRSGRRCCTSSTTSADSPPAPSTRSGELLGFVFGVTGVRDGELVHWSHMLGVRESARNLGLGRMLKEYQRDTLAELGVRRMFWSFDPLMAKNAYFNFNRLGASVVEYVPDMYGTTASPLHLGLPTDRIVVTTSTSAVEADRHPSRNGQTPVAVSVPARGRRRLHAGGSGVRRPSSSRYPRTSSKSRGDR